MRFIYGEPAMLLSDGKLIWLVVGDIHLGAERRLSERGINVYELWSNMSEKIKFLAGKFGATGIIILGDIKDSILYPESWEQHDIKRFVESLSGFNLRLLKGNHDGHIKEILGIEVEDEMFFRDFALLHGNKWPSQKAMEKGTIITGHNHIAVRITDNNNGVYYEKAWLISKIKQKTASKFYTNPKSKRLVVMPAFNPLITGTAVGSERKEKENINPLFRNSVFDYTSSDVYSLEGTYMGKVKSLSSAFAETKRNKKRISP